MLDEVLNPLHGADKAPAADLSPQVTMKTQGGAQEGSTSSAATTKYQKLEEDTSEDYL